MLVSVYQSIKTVKMKSTSVLIVVGIMCLVNVHADNNSTSVHGEDPITSEIWAKVTKIRADLQKMKADDKVDDQKLIADVQSLVTSVQADLKNSPSPLQSQLSGEVAAIQSKITQMTTSGKFDPTVLQLFKGIAKAVSGDTNGSKPGSSSSGRNATNAS